MCIDLDKYPPYTFEMEMNSKIFFSWLPKFFYEI